MNYLTANNTKLKKSGILGFGIPAYKSESGFTTCPMAQDCITGCYANQGTFIWPRVKAAYERRLQLTKDPNFVQILISEIGRRKPKYIRIHDSGDMYSPAYLNKWLEIINACPKTLFYTYTKMVRLLKSVSPLPRNFIVIYSEGGKEDQYIHRASDRHARIFPDLKSLQAAGYQDTHEIDLNALGPNRKIGLVYHGAKKKHFTTN